MDILATIVVGLFVIGMFLWLVERRRPKKKPAPPKSDPLPPEEL